jgi:hypothetical protein
MIRIFAVLLLLASSTCISAQSPQPFQYRVKLRLEAKQTEPYFSVASSSLNRELRNLGDVAVVEEDPMYEIVVVPMKATNQGGWSTGYALAATFLVRFNLTESKDVLKHLTPKHFEVAGLTVMDWAKATALASLPSEINGFVTTGLYLGPGIEPLCRELVADFDADVLIPQRKADQQFSDRLRKGLEKSKQ